VTELKEFTPAVGGFAEFDDSGIVNHRLERLKVVEAAAGLRRGNRYGILAYPWNGILCGSSGTQKTSNRKQAQQNQVSPLHFVDYLADCISMTAS
jgi:hypothetical protein